MKTVQISRLGHRAAWLLATALIFVQNAAQACPGCKQNMAAGADGKVPSLEGSSIAFSLSIFVMIFTVAALLGGLGFMMYRSCQTLAAQHRTTLERMEAEDAAAMLGLPAQA